MENIQRRIWEFAAYGTSTNVTDNGYICHEDGSVTVFSENGKGKMVSESTDGIAFYYTKIPADMNFTLQATLQVESWTLSNGQDGFGIMASDRVGRHGDPLAFWTNYYAAAATGLRYHFDGEKVSDVGDKIVMKLGIGAQEKIGVTPENLPRLEAGETEAVTREFYNSMTTLETSAAKYGEGIYNVIGNAAREAEGTLENPLTRLVFKIQRNNTGYFVSYIDGEGRENISKYYDRDALNQLDKEYIYVGFFASRNARVNFSEMKLEVISPKEDEPAGERPIQLVTPVCRVESGSLANHSKYGLVFWSNADGLLRFEELGICERVNADTRFKRSISLQKGLNEWKGTFVPDPDFVPGVKREVSAAHKSAAYRRLSSYEPVPVKIIAEFREDPRDVIYVSPDGCGENAGTKESPVDIYTAVACSAPGQKIYLMEGIYHLDKPVTIERGMDGRADQRIYLMADPEAKSRPVLNFGKKCAGLTLAADYWHMKGFDVTETGSCQKGILIAGSHNILEGVYAYRNGNTGIQLSKYKENDTREDWPSHNLVLHCTAYLNADPGYEDADGFAAKITTGEGNVFDGCISAYNADDGWDFFAKLEHGIIGKVIIRNSVAFKNGYDLDEEGNEIIAGNGNGFKMGGSSLSGHHELENCISFANREIGIDCNTCPDIVVKNAISFNNEGANVGFYTSEAKNTDFAAEGIISFKDGKMTNIDGEILGEKIQPKGSQNPEKIYRDSNYYFDGAVSANRREKQFDGGQAETSAQVDESWFVHLDTETAIHDRVKGICRREDGTINMNGFLELTEKVSKEIGARL